jgi:hypothetical protein
MNERLDEFAAQHHLTSSEVLRAALAEYLESHGNQPTGRTSFGGLAGFTVTVTGWGAAAFRYAASVLASTNCR